MTAYIDDVDEHGGCFTYWPTGHTAVARYFAKHPEAIDGSFQQTDGVRLGNEEGCESPAWRAGVHCWLMLDAVAGTGAVLYGDSGAQPVEFIGKAGDVRSPTRPPVSLDRNP